MKTIYIVRHAKSSWDILDIPDDKRPLMEKGRKRTGKVTDYFLDHQISVDRIISSHAVRALETARIIAQAIKYPAESIQINPQIYHSGSDGIFSQLYELSDHLNSVMIVGHNPALTDLANEFLQSPLDNLPTSGVVSISFDTDRWEKLSLSSHKTNFILLPKEMIEKS